MNYLQLVQDVVLQNGTISVTEWPVPISLAGNTNQRIRLIARYVNEAWQDIQNAHRLWLWMQGRFTVQTVVGRTAYAGTECTDRDSGGLITRFSSWGFKRTNQSDQSLSIYLTANGANEEGSMRWLDWDDFSQTQLRGVQTNNKPNYYSVNPATGRLTISPPPDNVYTLNGPYRKSNQHLQFDGDTPELPVDFHTVIKDTALIYLEGYDEGPRTGSIQMRKLPNFSMLEHSQLPAVTLEGTL